MMAAPPKPSLAATITSPGSAIVMAAASARLAFTPVEQVIAGPQNGIFPVPRLRIAGSSPARPSRASPIQQLLVAAMRASRAASGRSKWRLMRKSGGS